MGDHQEIPFSPTIRQSNLRRHYNDRQQKYSKNNSIHALTQTFLQYSAAYAVTEIPKFHLITPVVKSLHCFNISKKLNAMFSLLHIGLHLCKLVNLLISLFSPTHNRAILALLLSSPKSSFYTFRRKITNMSFYYSAPVLWEALPPNLRHISNHCNFSSLVTKFTGVCSFYTSIYEKFHFFTLHFFRSLSRQGFG